MAAWPWGCLVAGLHPMIDAKTGVPALSPVTPYDIAEWLIERGWTLGEDAIRFFPFDGGRPYIISF